MAASASRSCDAGAHEARRGSARDATGTDATWPHRERRTLREIALRGLSPPLPSRQKPHGRCRTVRCTVRAPPRGPPPLPPSASTPSGREEPGSPGTLAAATRVRSLRAPIRSSSIAIGWQQFSIHSREQTKEITHRRRMTYKTAQNLLDMAPRTLFFLMRLLSRDTAFSMARNSLKSMTPSLLRDKDEK